MHKMPYTAGLFLQKSPLMNGSFAERDLLKRPFPMAATEWRRWRNLSRSFSAKESCGQWLFCGKSPVVSGSFAERVLWSVALLRKETCNLVSNVLSLYVIFRKRALLSVALLRKETWNLVSNVLSLYVILRERVLWSVALLRKETCNLVSNVLYLYKTYFERLIFMGHSAQKSHIVSGSFAN